MEPWWKKLGPKIFGGQKPEEFTAYCDGFLVTPHKGDPTGDHG